MLAGVERDLGVVRDGFGVLAVAVEQRLDRGRVGDERLDDLLDAVQGDSRVEDALRVR